MSSCNLRSLLLAAIVISNCITWTASRHHYTHSVSGHRTRHRRQGQGLYLLSSYVIPGGEGEGWGEWGKVSPCSRTCGGGVASQKRICLQIGPDGQPQCTGGDTKYFSCETQDCPPGSPDFRAAQCAEFDEKDFRGYKYSWVPYTKAPNPCELNCMPHGERFYYRHKQKVIDGTRCNDDSFDVCVDGQCQPVGCDMMLGSNARADKCGECRGNGSNCYTNSGILDSQDYINGYNDILFIPQGSTSIVIEEIAPSDNYLALRATKNNTYYLNGHYKIDFPRTLEIAGAPWTYERSQLGFEAPDKLRSLGPTNEPLYLLLLQQSKNVGIRYEYSVPRNTSPPLDKQYNWVHDGFTPCSVSCGGGFQSRNVTCRSRQELEVVEDELCDEGLKPVSNQSCSTDPCPAQWVELPWSECSKKCGEGGLRSREVECQKIVSNGVASIIPDKECIETLGPKPKVFEECNQDSPCPTWFVGSWKPCDKLCGPGNQTRQVVCHQKINGRVNVLDENECEDEKPETNKSCMLEPCAGVDWMTTEWIGCNSCLSKVRTRSVLCVTNNYEIINDTFCAYHKKPVTEEPCAEEKNCTYMWYATQWGNCSVKCGEGNQTRKVFCGLFDEGNVKMVEDEKCADLEKYKDTKPCKIPKEKCPAQWFGGPWEECSKEYRGQQTRLVGCLDSNGQSGDCEGFDILDPTQSCNKSSDAATDVKATTMMDDDSDGDYCDEDDGDYEEEGLDEDLILMTTVLGDEPTYSDSTEDTLEDLEGSGSSETSDFTSTGTGFTKNLADTTTNTTRTGETSSLEYDDSTEYTITNTIIDANATSTIPSTGETELDTTSTVASSSSDANVTSSLNTTDTIEPTGTDVNSTDSETSTVMTSEGTTSNATESSTLASSTSEELGTEEINTTDLDTSTTTAITSEGTTSNSTETSLGTSSSTESSTTGKTIDFNATTSLATGSTKPTTTDVNSTDSATEASSAVTSDEFTSNNTESSTTSGSSDVNVTTSLDATQSTEVTGTVDSNATNTDIETSTFKSSEGTTSNSSESSTGSTESTSTDVNATDTSTELTSEGTTLYSTESSTATPSNTTDSTELTGTEITNTTEAESSTSTAITEETTSNETGSFESSTVSNTTDSLSSSGTTESTVTGETNTTDLETATFTSVTTEGTTSNDTESTTSDNEMTSNTTETSTISDISSTESNVTESFSATGSTEPSSTDNISIVSEITTSVTLTSEKTTGTGSTEAGTEKSTLGSSEGTTSSAPISENTTLASTEGSTDSNVTELYSTTESGETETDEVSTTSSYESTESTNTEINETSTISGTGTTEFTTISGSESTLASNETTLTEETEISTEETAIGSSTEGILIISSQSTSDWFTSLRTKGVCKRRKRKCENTPFGCCPDKKTPASGPFDKNCTKPETCKDTKFGCCPDGVSPAKGKNNKGCPTEPCEDTLFGCCVSDNKTAANGNDQEGCPPACVASEFGCCADNETAAIGPHKKGCPEAETTTTVAETETTTTETTTEETNTTITTESIPADNTTTTADTDTTAETGSTISSETNTTAETGTASGSEGTDSTESGSTVVSSCVESKFGCCYDNETEASGPEGQGCPCNATQFGCCPDGVAPAQGSQMEGCVESCNSSAHGCCPDGNSPAHGPNGEGCCLSAAFGCCPDNRKPAEGPHIEGCGCEYTIHGCCPDKVTIARGPNNEGCGCQYTKHGCCPDRHTEATGPNFEGCSCLTYQFGCCDDGVTMAKGPDKQGCNCRQSEYGCCGDQKTPATEPGGGGCDCSTSRFGCCPDGQTEATGPKFLGCTDVPVDKQAVCGLKADSGPCQNYTAMWYYDVEYGGCSRFWYGGCEGNGNKFATREECDDICVHPAPKDACKLPSVKGTCSGDFVRWAYNSSREQCLPFRFGGCLGNDNNFETRELCQSRCEPERSADQCSLPIEQGPCAGNFSHWGYNKETHRCEQFIWGGCLGNANRFSTEIACQMRCDPPGALKLPDKCTLPASAGECSNYRLKWFYDTGIKRCRQFYYGGCGGNDNNFETEAECDNSCSEDKLYTTTTTIKPTPALSPDVNEICLSGIDAGPCTSLQTRYGYDSVLGRCVPFQYGGCAGNRNNFPDEQTCSYHCHPVQDLCQLPMLEGPCTESMMRWFYDPSTDSCSQFTYGGCQGNDNRFESREACESRCKSSPAVTTTTTKVTTLAPTPAVDSRFKEVLPKCRITPSYEECTEPSVVWYLEPSRSECVVHINQERGNNCRYTATFPTQEGCERACGGFQGVDVCKQRVDPGPCDNYVVKVFFDQASGKCKEFQYGGCHGGPNRFSTIEECAEVCKPQGSTVEEDPCSLPPEEGNCVEYNPMWYYDKERGICGQFAYTGCGGNGNRFASEQDCQARCKVPVVSAPEPAEECVTPPSLAPCGDNMTVFYYNSERQMCAVAENGNCNYPNSYSTEEECQRRCGEFKGKDVCGAPLDPGPCRAAILKYYWDATTGSCQQFMYGGCRGGPNRFDNPEECETVCGVYKQAEEPAAPQALPPPEPRVTAVEGGVAKLRCVFHGNPPPKITWKHGEITIEGSFARYRLTSDGALEIVSVYRDDSGVYICIAKNELGTATQEIYLNVGDANEVAPADCRAYEQECASIQCDGDIQQVATQDGCRRCVCASTSCDELQQQCAALICPYGLRKTQEGNCERCSCIEDPCDTVNCGIGQHCEAVAYEDSQTQERRYTARCETDDVCAVYKQQCEEVSLTCRTTVQRSTDSNGCEKCICIENPCLNKNCLEGERCVVVSYRNAFESTPQNSPECRTINKPGQCPVDNEISVDDNCARECNDDADCRGAGKCCARGCSTVCALPDTAPPLTTTHAPDVPAPPQPLPAPEPQVSASEGGLATLRCLFHGNPPPKITWRRGELTIDGNVGRYRLTSDGALEIVSVYRNDTGVYICVADNGLGVSKQEVHLIVNDPVVSAAGIAGDENAVVVGELDNPLEVKCLAYGYPEPSVYWYRSDGSLVPFNNALFRARKNSLLIRRLTLDTLGVYTCQAYNGQDKAVSWAVVVQAYHPEGIILESEYLVPRYPAQPVKPIPVPTTRDTTTTTTTTTEVPPPLFTVPVSARISTPINTLNIGAELRLTCEVDGYPDPEVSWSKDGSRVVPNDRTLLSGSAGFSRLSISRVEVSDSGQYTCQVYNMYSTASDSVVMHVQQMMVPPKCTDNPFFANCDLIVRSKFCRHKYYSKFCCKSCVEAGQLDPEEAALQADQPFRRK